MLAAHVTKEEIMSSNRAREVSDARHAIWYVAHEHCHIPYNTLARLYERDHTTIMHGVRRIRAGKEADRITRALEKHYPVLMANLKKDESIGIGSWDFAPQP